MGKKIIDRERSYTSPLAVDELVVSSDYAGEHDTPSVYLTIGTLDTERFLSWSSHEPEQVKEIIRHMAEMIGCTVRIDELP